jgi:autotransporter-associated beta strand protein
VKSGLASTILLVAFAVLTDHSYAGSATWSLNPVSDEWTNPGNWTPATVPNGEIATSSKTTVHISANIEVDSIVFAPGADAFTLVQGVPTNGSSQTEIYGAGIVNDSGILQRFVAQTGASGANGNFSFYNNAAAGISTRFYIEASKSSTDNHGSIDFNDFSSAGSAIIINEGSSVATSALGGSTNFWDNATAGSATITVNGGKTAAAGNGHAYFYGQSSADKATLIANPALTADGFGGYINFLFSSTAGQATLTARGTIAGHSSGRIDFSDSTTGGTARVEIFGSGTVGIDSHGNFGLATGSIEGDGLIELGTNPLTIGTNNLSATFSGQILDQGRGGSLTKIGTGRLVLTGTNAYTGITAINDGRLLAENKDGSATGMGSVQVNAGVLGGRGIISGTVTLGTGSGVGAYVAPGQRPGKTGSLSIQGAVTFGSDAIYACELNSNSRSADKIAANGVTINSGAILLTDSDAATLESGTVFVIVSNSSTTPMSGTFSNLPDEALITVGNNTFQANYEGGDGNDLTLTVVP